MQNRVLFDSKFDAFSKSSVSKIKKFLKNTV